MSSPQLHSVASELLVRDRTLVVSAPPLSIATVGDMVWIAFSNGKVEVRNTRTGEVVRRFEPAVSAVSTSLLTDSGAADVLSKVANQVSAKSPIGVGGATGTSGLLKRHDNKDAAMELVGHSAIIVRALLAVLTVDGDTRVWMGLSNGCIEVHDGGVFTSSSGETVVGASNRPLTRGLFSLLRRHTAAVTSLAEFGGYVYSGSEDCQILQWRVDHSAHSRLFGSYCSHDGPVRCLCAEGNALISGSDDCTVKVWDIGECAMRLTGYFHSQSGGVLALCSVGEHMWSGDASGRVVQWHLRTCEAVAIHAPHSGRVLSLCRVGHRVYSGSSDGTMGIFDAANGLLLHHITDQALGWVTAIECPSELSRFVVWSSSADGAVRCWYQDEYTSMAADEMRFNDGSWYASGSTPYREFRAAVGQRTQRLKQQLEAIEHRDTQAMALLRDCSRVFGGSGSGLEKQHQRLQEQLAKVEEQCRAAQERVAARRHTVAQMDRDIAAALALLQNTRGELNLLLPGEAERVLASIPAIATEDLVAYIPPPPSAMLGTAATAPLIATSTTGAGATAPPPLPTSSAPLLSPPAVTASECAAAASASRPPPTSTKSTLGVGGPLTGAPPSLPLPSSVLPPQPPTATPLPGSYTLGVPAPQCNLPLQLSFTEPISASIVGAAPTAATAAAAAGVGAGVGVGAGTGIGAGAGVGVGAGAGVGAVAVDLAGTDSTPAGAGAAAVVVSSADDGVRWTNPHVGNYIQRRYYGASPSLRTIDLMKQERRRGRLPRVKVEVLHRAGSRANSAGAK